MRSLPLLDRLLRIRAAILAGETASATRALNPTCSSKEANPRPARRACDCGPGFAPPCAQLGANLPSLSYAPPASRLDGGPGRFFFAQPGALDAIDCCAKQRNAPRAEVRAGPPGNASRMAFWPGLFFACSGNRVSTERECGRMFSVSLAAAIPRQRDVLLRARWRLPVAASALRVFPLGYDAFPRARILRLAWMGLCLAVRPGAPFG
jgi:hypothetical protein